MFREERQKAKALEKGGINKYTLCPVTRQLIKPLTEAESFLKWFCVRVQISEFFKFDVERNSGIALFFFF